MQGDRVALGQALTLVESDRNEDRRQAVQLLDYCQKEIETLPKSIRMTISGAPGVGKSTLIEALGLRAVEAGFKVGVITVDPSSTLSLGSILGDKSRMQHLSVSKSAFVRSSPAGQLLGGIGRRSLEMMTLLSAAGYDLIFLETVGVGQSEHLAWQLTDGFMLVIQPGSGDELQGIKRGITELADIIIVNKSDGELQQASTVSLTHYQQAVHYLTSLRPKWTVKVLSCSALQPERIDELWEVLRLYMNSRLENNQLVLDRKSQYKFWLTWSLGISAHEIVMKHPIVKHKLDNSLMQIEKNNSMFSAEYEIENTIRGLLPSESLPQP